MSNDISRPFDDPAAVSIPPSNGPELSHRQDGVIDDRRASAACDLIARAAPRWTTVVARSLICAAILTGAGCPQGESGPREYSEEEAQAQLQEVLAATPEAPPDTPEQVREKEAKVEETLPQVYAMLEEVKTDPEKVDEVVELSMSLVTLIPSHREAKVAYCRAQLAAFLAKEPTDPYNRTIAINSAVLELDRLRKTFDDLSHEELQLCHDVYFNQARMIAYFPNAEDAPDEFKEAIDKLMSTGFQDAERLKTEPKFEKLFSNPKFAPVLEGAIAQIEGAGQAESPEEDPAE